MKYTTLTVLLLDLNQPEKNLVLSKMKHYPLWRFIPKKEILSKGLEALEESKVSQKVIETFKESVNQLSDNGGIIKTSHI